MKRYFLIAFVTAAFLLSCSSKPADDPDRFTKRNQAAEYVTYGNTYYDSAMYEQALGFFRMALELNISIDNEKGMTENFISLGKTLIVLGKRNEGRDRIIQAVELSRRIGDNELIVLSLTNLGESFLADGDIKNSRPLINEALELSATISGTTETMAVLYHNAGVLAKYDGDLENAMDYFNRASQINSRLEKLNQLAANYYMISSVYSKQERYDKAVEYAHLALENDKKTEHSYGIAKDIHALAIIYGKSGLPAESYEYYKKAYLIYNTLKLKTELMKVLEELMRLAPEYGSAKETQQFAEDYELLKEHT